jgi:hypothetical protein
MPALGLRVRAVLDLQPAGRILFIDTQPAVGYDFFEITHADFGGEDAIRSRALPWDVINCVQWEVKRTMHESQIRIRSSN